MRPAINRQYYQTLALGVLYVQAVLFLIVLAYWNDDSSIDDNIFAMSVFVAAGILGLGREICVEWLTVNRKWGALMRIVAHVVLFGGIGSIMLLVLSVLVVGKPLDWGQNIVPLIQWVLLTLIVREGIPSCWRVISDANAQRRKPQKG